MQAELFMTKTVTAWQRAAIRECISYGDHGSLTEIRSDGSVVCFDCGAAL